MTDLPWVNGKVRRLIRRRKANYRKSGRNAAWNRLSGIVRDLLRERKRKYEESQKLCLLADDAVRHFLKNCQNYQSKDCPKQFDPRKLFPGKTDVEVAEALEEHFNAISNELCPLEPGDIPETFSAALPVLTAAQVSTRIKFFKKSMVKTGVHIRRLLAIRLQLIFNKITHTIIWPAVWKEEYM